MSNAVADRHNFGQQVKPTEGLSFRRCFQKPRTVFWEWLFFGRTSPLKTVFEVRGQNTGLFIDSPIFNLDVVSEGEWSGTSKEILGATNEEMVRGNLEMFARFGMLLGYAYVFGIRDLHRANLIRTGTHLQVIDAEVVFADIILPHETLLLPFKEVSWKECGLSLLAESADSITNAESHAILAGYVDILSVISEKKYEILETLNALDLNHPLRIILRNTGEYSAELKSPGKIKNLLDGESAQLERGDIPYFFKRLGNPNVQWVSGLSKGGVHELSELVASAEYEADIGRHAVLPENLIFDRTREEDRLKTRLLRGVMYLRKHLGASGHFFWRDLCLHVPSDPSPVRLDSNPTSQALR